MYKTFVCDGVELFKQFYQIAYVETGELTITFQYFIVHEIFTITQAHCTIMGSFVTQ